nr:hypothetical protein [Tanacetum cinerariifolium]
MHKAFPLPRESSHWQYKFPLPVKVVLTARRLEMPLPEVCIAIEEMMKKLPAKIKNLDALSSLLNKEIKALDSPSKNSPYPEGEIIKKEKGKKAMSLKDVEKERIESESYEEANLTGTIGESSKKKKMKKFDFITRGGDHIHLIEEQINEQKRIEESIKAELAKQKVEVGKEELVDLLGIDVVKGFYKAKLRLVQIEKEMDGPESIGKSRQE